MEFRDLPQVDALARHPDLASFPEAVRTHAAREAISAARKAIQASQTPDVVQLAQEAAERRMRFSLRSVINLSGVVLHTGLGRARLARAAIEHMTHVAEGYADVEFDLDSGARGDRQNHVEGLLRELTGGEAALVVNNAAAGVLLTLSALAEGKEVVLSRGQMIEIGGAFRMPHIVRKSGARLCEIGCTNKTHLRDYIDATHAETALWLRCHPSNFRVIGFTEEPSLAELRQAADQAGVPFVNDQGNGALLDFARLGLPPDETLPESVRWAHVSIASGDKLLGGPQAGLIVGGREWIAKIKRHPMARAVRVDKLTLAALEATLRLYVTGREREIPTIAYLTQPLEAVRTRAEQLAGAWSGAVIEPGVTEVGSGAAPGMNVPTWRVGLDGDESEVARTLRAQSPPIIARIEDGRVWLDPRCVEEDELDHVVRCLREMRA